MKQERREEPLFELIKNMSKAEKRNFKLYATRLSSNREAKYLQLFDYLDTAERYAEEELLEKLPISKSQLPNTKAHLYQQLLVSIRQLGVKNSQSMQLREELDFALILFDKGLYQQSEKIAQRVRAEAERSEDYGAALEVVDLQSRIAAMSIPKNPISSSRETHREIVELAKSVETKSELQDTASRSYALYQQLGYARTQRDLDMIRAHFQPKLRNYAQRVSQMSFYERYYYYQAAAWYYYIQQEFVLSYRYGRSWVELFEGHPKMKRELYDGYIKGAAQILDGLYLMRKYRQLSSYQVHFEREFAQLSKLNQNAERMAKRVLLTNRIHICFLRGEFGEGLRYVKAVESYIEECGEHLEVHHKMLLYYKIACLYFGDQQYENCIEYLDRITKTKDPKIRRDLQCFSRILKLIASYEAGIDYDLERQIRSTYAFIVKMNDMQAVQSEMMNFLKRLGHIYASELKGELALLYERLKPYEKHPYERRLFLYLDVLSWLESKITGRSVAEIVREKFLKIE